MRIDRIDLTRYGKFTDQAVEFGPATTPDLHVIHGPNEAGKSTLLSAWLDLLFRVPERSAMNFLHDYKSMQLGGVLNIGGKPHALTRVKKRDGSLLDGSGAPVPEALISGALHGMDRGSYTAMFSLNRQTLEEGGESILASEGDLGELLFQASAGLSDLSAQLSGHDAETQAFLNHTGRKGHLRDLGKELAELGDRIKALDTQAAGFARLVEARDTAQERWHAAKQALNAATRRRVTLEALRNGQRIAVHLQRLDSQIAGFGALPVPPEEWLRQAGELDRAETELRAQLKAAEGAVAGLEQDLAKLPEDDEILALAEPIAAAQALKPAHDTALDDLPKRYRERDGDHVRRADILARLGQAEGEASALLLDAATHGKLRDLVEIYASLHEQHRAARAERLRADTRAEQAAARLTEAGGAMADPAALRGMVARLRGEDPRGASDRAKRDLDTAETTLVTAIAALAPWRGDAAELPALVGPDRLTLLELGQNMTAADQDCLAASATRDRLAEEAEACRATLEDLEPDEATSEDEAARVRARREAAWAAHRARLDTDSADRFEQAMRLDDRITATLADRTAQAERSKDARLALTRAEHRVAKAQEALDIAQAHRSEVSAQLTAARRALSPELPDSMDAAALADWLVRRDTAHAALIARNDAARAVTRTREREDRARVELLQVLSHAGRDLPTDTGLGPALENAQALLDDVARLATLSEAAREARDDLSERQRMEQEAVQALDHWQADWEKALDGTAWADAPPDAAEMRSILEELVDLRQVEDHLRGLDHRIETMEANRERFAKSVRDLADPAGIEAGQALDVLWTRVTTRLRQAEDSEARRRDLRDRLARAEKELQALTRESAGHEGRVAQICDFFGVADWPGARALLEQAAKRAELVKERGERADELCETLGVEKVDRGLEELDGADASTISAEIEQVAAGLPPLRVEQDESHAAFREAEAALEAVGGDGEVARLEEARQTCLVQIEEGARAHLRARLGLVAVEDALRRYRDAHRSGMMTRASDAFRTITGGAYAGLTTQTDGSREVLVALPVDGGSRQAVQLSEGTRAQLYLALRIAGYHEFVAQNGPVPFIADDIMESFDDDRARATFGLLAEMSSLGQVIYLTHHSHMRDLAQAACAEVKLHELA